MSREREYQSTTYYGIRKDGSKYMIAQVGDNEIDGKKYYRYYYADVSQDGKLSNQIVVYSNTNVAHFINERNFGRYIPEGYEEALDNILFSKDNIRDSLSKGTFYIGQVRKTRSDNKLELVSDVSEITKSEDDQKKLSYPTKQYTRNDGSSFVVQQMNRGQDANGIKVNCYHIFEVIKENGRQVVKRNVVYSEQDILKDNREGIANDFLSRDRLARKVGEAGGYIGYYDKYGIRTYNPNLVQYFKSTESEKVKPKTTQKDKEQTTAQFQNTPSGKELTQEQKQRKMQWIKGFVKDYEDTEQPGSYALRSNCEDENIRRVVESIKAGKFIEVFDNYAQNDRDNPNLYVSKLASAMARLLKAADNLTIDGGTDYLEQFAGIPAVNKILLQIRDSEYAKQMHTEADEKRRTVSVSRHHRTRAEIDKQYAQEYLRSNNIRQSSAQAEIDYRRGLTTRDLLKVSDEVDKNNIPMIRRQQVSLAKVLARQDGKIPSEEYYDGERKGWYCITDTQMNQDKQHSAINSNMSGSEVRITPNDIAKATVGIGLQEIKNVTGQVRRLIRRQELSQEQQKSR